MNNVKYGYKSLMALSAHFTQVFQPKFKDCPSLFNAVVMWIWNSEEFVSDNTSFMQMTMKVQM